MSSTLHPLTSTPWNVQQSVYIHHSHAGGTAQKAGEKAEGLGKKMEGEEKAKK